MGLDSATCTVLLKIKHFRSRLTTKVSYPTYWLNIFWLAVIASAVSHLVWTDKLLFTGNLWHCLVKTSGPRTRCFIFQERKKLIKNGHYTLVPKFHLQTNDERPFYRIRLHSSAIFAYTLTVIFFCGFYADSTRHGRGLSLTSKKCQSVYHLDFEHFLCFHIWNKFLS